MDAATVEKVMAEQNGEIDYPDVKAEPKKKGAKGLLTAKKVEKKGTKKQGDGPVSKMSPFALKAQKMEQEALAKKRQKQKYLAESNNFEDQLANNEDEYSTAPSQQQLKEDEQTAEFNQQEAKPDVVKQALTQVKKKTGLSLQEKVNKKLKEISLKERVDKKLKEMKIKENA
jgi:hypothetical protein